MKKIIIHVGHQKCGSTLLQKSYFNSLSNWDYHKISILSLKLFNTPEYLYDTKFIEKFVRKNFIFKKSQIILSCENLNFFQTNLNGMFHPDLVCKRLFKLFPNSTIFMVVRNQVDWIESFYKNCVRGGFCYTFEEYFNKMKKEIMLESLKYDLLINYYKKLFKKIVIVPFEKVISNDCSDIFVKMFGENLIVKKSNTHNESHDYYTSELTRKIFKYTPSKSQQTSSFFYNWWRYKQMNRINKITSFLKKKNYIDLKTKKEILDYFYLSNKNLEKLSGHNLKDLGYFN